MPLNLYKSIKRVKIVEIEGCLFLKRSVYFWEIELRSGKIDGLIARLSPIFFAKSNGKGRVIGFP
jgi:hypothetical protein